MADQEVPEASNPVGETLLDNPAISDGKETSRDEDLAAVKVEEIIIKIGKKTQLIN